MVARLDEAPSDGEAASACTATPPVQFQARTGVEMFFSVCSPQSSKLASRVRAHILVHHVGNADAARIRKRLKARGDVYAVAIDVVPIDDYITEIDADAQLEIVAGPGGLNLNCAFDRIYHAGKLDQRAISNELYGSTVVPGESPDRTPRRDEPSVVQACPPRLHSSP